MSPQTHRQISDRQETSIAATDFRFVLWNRTQIQAEALRKSLKASWHNGILLQKGLLHGVFFTLHLNTVPVNYGATCRIIDFFLYVVAQIFPFVIICYLSPVLSNVNINQEDENEN